MKAIIIDDIEKARIALKSDIHDFCNEIEVVGEAEGVKSGVELIINTQPDVVFLDIKMGDGSGFDLIEKIRNEEKIHLPQIIFTTAYDEYAIKAFKFSAIDYLLKPVDPDDLIMAVGKLKTVNSKVQIQDSLSVLMEQIGGGRSKPLRLALHSVERVHIVEINEIVRCEAHKNYTLFVLTSGQQILVTKTLKDFDELLGPHDFYRSHHSHLVNLAFVKEFVKIDGSYLVLRDGKNVPVSVRKKEGLLKRLSDFN